MNLLAALDTPESLCSDLDIVYTWQAFFSLITFDAKFLTVPSNLLSVRLTEGSYNWESLILVAGRAE